MRRMSVALVTLTLLCVIATSRLGADVSIEDRGSWPKTWPKDLESLRTEARTIEGSLAGYFSYEIPFTKRDDFESAWPHLLKVRSPEYPIILVRSPHAGTGATKGNSMKAGVLISSSPIASRDADTTTVIVVVVDGDIVDLNRIELPGNTHVQDERFKDDGITKP